MAKAYPPVKMKVGRKATKGAPKDLGPRGRAGTKNAKPASSISDTTKTAKQTRTTVGKSHSQENTPAQKKQKAARTKRKMKANLKAAKPSGVTKTMAQKAAAKGAGKVASRLLGPVGAAIGAGQLVGAMTPSSGRTSKGGQMNRKKK